MSSNEVHLEKTAIGELLFHVMAERDALRAENERLLLDNAELSAECDQWQKKVADCWREIERLRAQLT